MIDVLHTLDLGFSQDVLGNIFWEWMHSTSCTATNKAQRVAALWLEIQKYYKECKPPTRINRLTEDMVKRSGKSRKFKGKLAETRHLVAFALELAMEMNKSYGTTHSKTVKAMMANLYNFYILMGSDAYDPQQAGDFARQCCILYTSLREEAEAAGKATLWKVKPKMHMFIEMAEGQSEEAGNPSDFWTYMDEDFMGFIGQMAGSRGGKREVSTTPVNVLKRYKGLIS